jgi:hypothetical protein
MIVIIMCSAVRQTEGKTHPLGMIRIIVFAPPAD